jgi:hypothetical protein
LARGHAVERAARRHGGTLVTEAQPQQRTLLTHPQA